MMNELHSVVRCKNGKNLFGCFFQSHMPHSALVGRNEGRSETTENVIISHLLTLLIMQRTAVGECVEKGNYTERLVKQCESYCTEHRLTLLLLLSPSAEANPRPQMTGWSALPLARPGFNVIATNWRARDQSGNL